MSTAAGSTPDVTCPIHCHTGAPCHNSTRHIRTAPRARGRGRYCLAFSRHKHKCKGAPWGQRLELTMHQATVSPISIVRSAALALGCFVVLFSDTAYAQVPNIH